MRLSDRFQINRPLEQLELDLVRYAMEHEGAVAPGDEALLRTALSLARLYKLRAGEKDIGVGAFLHGFREDVSRVLTPVLARGAPNAERIAQAARALDPATRQTRRALLHRLRDRVDPQLIDHEIRHKSLVIVSGGGGGTGYVYLGVMTLLDEFGLKPALMAGTSMGAILSMFRSRMERFDYTQMINIVRGLSWRKLFRAISTESRYGVPAALRLFLRAGIGRYFNVGSETHGSGLRLKDLPIPTIVIVSGIRRGMLPHPLEFYERLINVRAARLFDPIAVARRIQAAVGALGEFFLRPEMMVKLTLGTDPDTREFDALDAAGFSSALPGVIHYDVLRDDPRMRQLLDELVEAQGIFRFVDGGLTDNLPAKAAWKAVHRGMITTRNTLIVGLNGFSPKLSTPLWLPLQRLAAMTVAPNLPYLHVRKDFKKTLSPLELVPSVELATRAVELGRAQFMPEMPLLCRMLTPLPAIG